ncbi:unnamed protein product [Oppiella nova]|uniref:Myb-like domain-containing protein n=1 Tax=Oppiella nova TaxID=334625 RepID=A0A7R9QUU2_9ACAR|nr:unnamed protein product [Oppiella nova]CAG2176414.1 unnamed protein product [Oppiella nova]
MQTKDISVSDIKVSDMCFGGDGNHKYLTLKYTDIDYTIFSDGARHVWAGRSPYLRDTYRYTPLIAALLVPNITLWPQFGKVLFSVLDVVTGALVYHICGHHLDQRRAKWCAIIWLYNPDVSYVNKFYNFWYDFDSWREYSWLDEEEKEKGENREERRWMEKQNKAARAQRKKEEMQRMRQLVDNAYQCDPRIARFKEEEKQKKLSQKLAKQQSIREKQLEEERLKREAEEKQRLEKLEKENELKAKKNEEKKQKEFVKKQIRKERKLLETMFETYDYFAKNESKRIDNLKEFDKIIKIYSLEELQTFREEFSRLESEDSKRDFFLKKIDDLNSKLDSERIGLSSANNSTNGQTNNISSKKNWSYDDIQLLIKAIKLFPAGTPDRWAVIAKWVNDKSTSGVVRNHRDVIAKAKDLQNNDQSQSLKEEANKNAYKKLDDSHANKTTAPVVSDTSTPSQRFDAPRTLVDLNANPWNNEEQQLLEQAMKTYPTSLGIERWDLISKCIPNRSRTDCIARYKYLVDLVKSKRDAKTAIHTNKK